jgi:hypothetical protein
MNNSGALLVLRGAIHYRKGGKECELNRKGATPDPEEEVSRGYREGTAGFPYDLLVQLNGVASA